MHLSWSSLTKKERVRMRQNSCPLSPGVENSLRISIFLLLCVLSSTSPTASISLSLSRSRSCSHFFLATIIIVRKLNIPSPLIRPFKLDGWDLFPHPYVHTLKHTVLNQQNSFLSATTKIYQKIQPEMGSLWTYERVSKKGNSI